MPRIVDHDQRREELAGHVWTLIRQQGISGVTIRNLSKQSGWSSGAIRHYLPTHESILTFAAERLGQAVERELQALPLDAEAPKNLEQFLLALLPLSDPAREWTEVWLAFAAAAVRGEQYADSHGILYRDLNGLLREILGDFADKGHLPEQTPEQAAGELQALIDGLCLHLLLRQITAEQAVQSVRGTLQRMLQLPPARQVSRS